MFVRRVIAGLSLAAAMFLCADAHATDVIIKSVDVPFDFVVRGQVLPAGTYTILKTDLPQDLLIIRNVRTHSTISTLSFPEGKSSNTPRLVFDTVGDKNVLRAVISPSSYSTVNTLKREKRIAGMNAAEPTAGR